jgi:hypothetical protein
MGVLRYPEAPELFITADAGGSNSARSNVWKARLQEFADRYNLTVHVSHFPPGTSKWNKIEHRLFSFITMNWRGRPLTNYETVVALIAATKTSKGLQVNAELDTAKYPLGVHMSSKEMKHLSLEGNLFHGDWNYVLRPRTPELIAEAKSRAPQKRIPKRPFWTQVVQEQQASGLNSAQFCRLRGFNYATFSTWRARIAGVQIRQHNRAFWVAALRQQLESGVSSRDYCTVRDLNHGSFVAAGKRYRGSKSEQ